MSEDSNFLGIDAFGLLRSYIAHRAITTLAVQLYRYAGTLTYSGRS